VGDITVQRTESAISWADGVPYLRLDPIERREIREVAESVVAEFAVTDPAELELHLNDIAVHAHRLPERLRFVLNEFRLTGRPLGGLVLAGLPVREDLLGPTPASYEVEVADPEVVISTAVLLLAGSLLGDPFSYYSQQKGKLVLDVFPIAGHEDEQLGSSSATLLEWHNEDAFHPHRADWIMLLGLRNPDAVPTMFAPVAGLDLGKDDFETLFEDRFVILPDESHTATFNSSTTGFDTSSFQEQAFERIRRMNTEPQRIAVLSGDPASPYVRIDPAFMRRELGDDRAEQALAAVIKAFEARMMDIALGSGDLMVIDNLQAVHGRRPFKARYDGSDRWLRRINITGNLRASAGRRYGAHGRALV
jgi:Fe(II)/alpha-ketoglutarate-dependent arginine beta-hydroxylase